MFYCFTHQSCFVQPRYHCIFVWLRTQFFLPLKYLIHQKMKWAPFFRANPISAKVMPSLISWFIFTHLVYMYIYYTNNPIVHLLPNHQLSYPSIIKHGGIIPPYFDDVPGESSISFVDFARHGSYQHRRPVESMPWPWRCDGGFGPRACRGATALGAPRVEISGPKVGEISGGI